MIIKLIKEVTAKGKAGHLVILLDLKNFYGSIPYKLTQSALDGSLPHAGEGKLTGRKLPISGWNPSKLQLDINVQLGKILRRKL